MGVGRRTLADMGRQMTGTTHWRDRPTFVTGASGLVGGWLVQRLAAAGADIVCLVRDWVPKSHLLSTSLANQVTAVRGDVRDQAFLERVIGEYEIDTVIHLAAQTTVPVANRNPISTFDTNIGGTWALLEACRRSPMVKSVVVASSDKAYGESETLPYDENTPLRGRHPYDVSKSCADLIAQSYATTYQMPVAVTRCGNFYGGGDLNWNRIVPGTIRAILRGQSPIIRSDGQNIRDYFYVEDGAAAYMLLAEKLSTNPELSGEAFNFSTETKMTVLEIVERILAAMKSALKPDIRAQATNEIREQLLDATKAKTRLAWKPLYAFSEGLERTVDWYRAHLRDA
jgi:CDP-glucose 4,6-dehydratase